jgi:hypothetical protein
MVINAMLNRWDAAAGGHCRPDLADDDARAADAALLLDLVEGLTAASFAVAGGLGR